MVTVAAASMVLYHEAKEYGHTENLKVFKGNDNGNGRYDSLASPSLWC